MFEAGMKYSTEESNIRRRELNIAPRGLNFAHRCQIFHKGG